MSGIAWTEFSEGTTDMNTQRARVIHSIGLCLLLLVIAAAEVWTVWREMSESWSMSAPDMVFLSKYVFGLFVPMLFTFIVASRKGRVFGFICAICVSAPIYVWVLWSIGSFFAI